MTWKNLKTALVILAVTSAIAFNTWTTAQVYEMRVRVAVVERDVAASKTANTVQDTRALGTEGLVREIAVDVAYIRGQLEN